MPLIATQPTGEEIRPTHGAWFPFTATVWTPCPSLPVIRYCPVTGSAVVGANLTVTVSVSPGATD